MLTFRPEKYMNGNMILQLMLLLNNCYDFFLPVFIKGATLPYECRADGQKTKR
jgi:hypothetical protein